MTELNIRRNGDESADFDLPEGCPVCGNTVAIRVSPREAYSCCQNCRWISRPQVEFTRGGLKIAYPATAQA